MEQDLGTWNKEPFQNLEHTRPSGSATYGRRLALHHLSTVRNLRSFVPLVTKMGISQAKLQKQKPGTLIIRTINRAPRATGRLNESCALIETTDPNFFLFWFAMSLFSFSCSGSEVRRAPWR